MGADDVRERASTSAHGVRSMSRRFAICPLPLLGPLSRPGGQASKRGGTSLPRGAQTLMECEEGLSPPGIARSRRVPDPLVPLVAAQRWRHSLLHAPESHTANAGPIRRSSRSRAPSWPGTPDVHTADPCDHEHCQQIVTAVCAAEGPFQCAPAIGRSGAG
jgi:hypothetical protein